MVPWGVNWGTAVCDSPNNPQCNKGSGGDPPLGLVLLLVTLKCNRTLCQLVVEKVSSFYFKLPFIYFQIDPVYII